MTIGAVIQARMGSTRLPGKVLMDLDGSPVLLHIIRRLRLVPEIERVIVATSQERQDDPIAAKCRDWRVDCYRGDERDVLDRMWRAAALHGLGTVVRITADCPLLDPNVVSQVIRKHQHLQLAYCSNVFVEGQPVYTYPDGLDCEVISMQALDTAWDEASSKYDREHVTPYIWRQTGRFNQAVVQSTGSYGHLRWTLDTAEDLERIRQLVGTIDRHDTDYRSLLERG